MAESTKKGQQRPARNGASRTASRRKKLFTGGMIVAAVLALGIGYRLFMQRNLGIRLQGTVDGHYTKGTAGAPVVIKEFSDFT